ncbi:MAG: HypC/HybG/HupF family hydrogenase formation chaperone, partial [Halorhodospira sp.]
MCVGIPMQIVEPGEGCALAELDGERRWISTLLVAEPALGDWVLVQGETARASLSEGEARRTLEAWEAVQAAARGGAIEHLLADLVERESELPPHLRPETGAERSTPQGDAQGGAGPAAAQ